MDAAAAYESHAIEFLRRRDRSPVGMAVVNRWARDLRHGASVVELACGGGFPITKTLSAAGLQLWAVDSSPTLVDVFQSRFPDIPIQCATVQESSFFDQMYDGVIAIGLVFLLSVPEQIALLSSIARILRPGGRFLFTAPIEKGCWKDRNTGVACKSMGQELYEDHLMNAGFQLVATYIDSGENNFYDVERMH